MSQVTVYTTEPCGYCRVAKALLDKRGIAYEEINLAKDPEGRAGGAASSEPVYAAAASDARPPCLSNATSS